MRSYADVAATQMPSQKPSANSIQKNAGSKNQNPGQALHQQLAAIASQLGAVVANSAGTQDVIMTPQSVCPPPTVQGAPPQDSEAEKQAMVAKIKQLETSLASIPDGPECKHIRDAITQQIAGAKAKINSSKPLAARLEGCQAALERSKKRLAAAESLAQSALAAQEVATAEVSRYQAELNEVQSLMAQQLQTATNGSCLDKLHAQMQSIIVEMAGSGHVEVAETQQTMQNMSVLFHQLTAIAAKARVSAAATGPDPLKEQVRLQQMLIDNAVALPVEGQNPNPPVATKVGEPTVEVITGGG